MTDRTPGIVPDAMRQARTAAEDVTFGQAPPFPVAGPRRWPAVAVSVACPILLLAGLAVAAPHRDPQPETAPSSAAQAPTTGNDLATNGQVTNQSSIPVTTAPDTSDPNREYPFKTEVVPTLTAGIQTTAQGTVVLGLGARPAAADSAYVEVSCHTAGTIRWPSGAETPCAPRDTAWQLDPYEFTPLPAGATIIAVTASPGLTYDIRAWYTDRHGESLPRNARGQTYGKAGPHMPDLVAILDRSGKQAYLPRYDLETISPPPRSPLWDKIDTPRQAYVYKQDGRTIVGVCTLPGKDGFDIQPITPQPTSDPPTKTASA